LKKLFITQIIALIAFILPPSVSFASHIVGGEMTYKYVKRDSQNNKIIHYFFTLKVYKDILSGTDLDLRPIVSVFVKQENGTYVFLKNSYPQITSQYNVQPPKLPCTETPAGVGVEAGVYNWTEILPEINTNYLIVYQRCCRNPSISNIHQPGNTGSSYFVELTPEAQKINNNSPVFQQLPPIFICANQELDYNHSATDVEGHQLVYKLCNSFQGGSPTRPVPDPATNPPYLSVNYNLPNYSSNTPMGGNPIVSIDPITGKITGTPTILGQFVVTVCVEEYSNGVLLSTIFRDFQFNVVSCRRLVVSKLQADSVFGKTFKLYGCDTVTLTLNNTSYERNNVNNFYWEFKKGTQISRYTDWSPTITFRDTGSYTGKLVLNPGQECTDSAFVEVTIGGKVKPSFNLKYDTCVAGPVVFQGSIESNIPLSKIRWSFGDFFSDSNSLQTTHQYKYPSNFTTKLSIADKFGCKGEASRTFTWQPAPPILIVEPSAFIGCAPSQVFFKNNSTPIDATYKIAWDFGDGTNSTEISPKHTYTRADSFTVKLLITSPIGCKKEAVFRNWIKIKPIPTADFDWSPKVINNLAPSVFFSDKSSSDVIGWRWFFSAKTYSNQKNPAFSYRDTGVQTVQLYVTSRNGCKDSISKTIYIEPEMTFYMPTAFSPNYDSMNDIFKGTGFLYGLKAFRIRVWNRWGEQIFDTTDPNEGWNGQKNNTGLQVPEGIYLYEVEYTTPKNEKKRLNNFVTLYR
jgi:gliding motility-associated-like protein